MRNIHFSHFSGSEEHFSHFSGAEERFSQFSGASRDLRVIDNHYIDLGKILRIHLLPPNRCKYFQNASKVEFRKDWAFNP